MNTELLLALGLALGVGVVVALLLRSRKPPTAHAAPARPATAALARPAAVAPQPGQTPQRPPPDARPAAAAGATAQIDAQRQQATEALRLARQRKAEEAARLEAERAGQARADAAARAPLRAPAPAATPAPARPLPADTARPAVVAAPTRPLPERPLLSPLAISTHTSSHTNTGTGASAGTGAAAPRAGAPGLAPLRGAPAPRQPLVLLADDSKVVRVKTGRLLEKQGWQVLLAEDGTAALLALEAHAPDLLITDVEMPGLDGFELTRRVRAHARFARLPVIMITSSDERHRAEANAAGVNLLLGKPYAEETLLAQVQVMLAAAAQRAGLALH